MYNLIVQGFDGWEEAESFIEFPKDRLFEYTSAKLRHQFEDLFPESEPLYTKLAELPCVFMSEGREDEKVYIGNISDVHNNRGTITFKCILDRELAPICNKILYKNRRRLGIEEWEFNRNHWAVKEAELYHILLQIEKGEVRQRPKVFNLNEREKIDNKQVSAMMPFAKEFDAVYEVIKDAARDLDLRCDRADEVWETSEVMQDVVNLIDHSKIVICDCSGKNPNVFYEMGIAHTLGREVILITKNEHDIPFDVGHLRHICYLNNGEGLQKLKEQLKARIKTLLGNKKV